MIDKVSEPVGRKELLEYVPIQYIVKYIKQYHKLNHKEDYDKVLKEKPIDGFTFKSSLTGELNYLFFSDENFELKDDIRHVIINKTRKRWSTKLLRRLYKIVNVRLK